MKVLATVTASASLLFLAAPKTAVADSSSARTAICYVFGSYCSQALRVAWCESRYSIWAHNGQYLGLFQMGSSERARYGHGWNAWAQAVSAYRYFVDSGRTWGPWTCKP